MINLLVRAILNEQGRIRTIVAKGRNTVSYYHRSPQATYFFQQKQKLLLTEDKWHALIQDVVTRWNSTVAMLERLSEQMAPIHAVARDPELKGKVKDLTQYLYKFDEQIIVEGLVKILKPFKVASEMLSSTRDPTLSLVLPSLHDMKQKLQPVVLEVPNRNEESDEEEEESDEMKAHKVLEKVKGKMLKLIDEKLVTTEHHEIASMLDPATKGWIIQKKSSDYVQKKLIKMISENANEEPVRIKQEPQDDSENTENVPPLPDLPALPDPGPSSPDQKKVKIENEPPSHWLADVLITKVEAPDPKVAKAGS